MKTYHLTGLGVLYLAACVFLTHSEIVASQGKAEWTGFGIVLAGMATGVIGVVWGHGKDSEKGSS